METGEAGLQFDIRAIFFFFFFFLLFLFPWKEVTEMEWPME